MKYILSTTIGLCFLSQLALAQGTLKDSIDEQNEILREAEFNRQIEKGEEKIERLTKENDELFQKRLEAQQETWDLKFCQENASFVRQVVIPRCNGKNPPSDCKEKLFHFYRAKCERWNL